MTISLKNKIIESLEDIKAVNPVAINVKKISSLTDFMIIASGTSNRHITAISEKVIDGLKKNKIKEVKVEGQGGDDWVLVDDEKNKLCGILNMHDLLRARVI